MNPIDIQKTLTELSQITGLALTMPLPKRMSLDEVKFLKKLVLGEDLYNKMMKIGSQELSSAQALEILVHDGDFKKLQVERRFDQVTLVSTLMIFRHIAKSGPTFTVNPALNLLLADTAIKEDVPALYFSAPFPTCFIEFDPADRREQTRHRIFSGGVPELCEGALIQETRLTDLRKLRPSTREALELDPNKPARVIEIGLTASPIGSATAYKTQMPVAFDNVDLITLYIQDEQESIHEILMRHFKLYESFMLPIADMKTSDGRTFKDLFEENFAYISKVLFYLNVQKNELKVVNESSDLEKRLDKVADKKKEKLKRQLHRVYDRIIVGPSHYTPIKDLMAAHQLPKGTKAPHYRRGYFGIRWKGTGQNKTPELIRVSHTIVNEHLLGGAESKAVKSPKDYEIR